MNASIIAVTQETNDTLTFDIVKAETFAGKMAGICYMKENYFDSTSSDDEASLKRFHNIGGMHHSISDHCQITVLFQNISKFQAMLLNSLQVYTTSEKSARYTTMSNMSDQEKDLYYKWQTKLFDMIKKFNNNMSDNDAKKKALENARYFISIFSKCTTMAYTTSLRQWNYIISWCRKYISENTFFETNTMINEVRSLLDMIIGMGLEVEELADFKGRKFDKFGSPLDTKTENIIYSNDYFYYSYKTTYNISFAGYAQAERHRTIKYYTDLSFKEEWFVPPIVKLYKEEDEWNEDMKSILHLRPQGQLITVAEVGTLDDFVLKCKERLCNKAQLEIMKQTYATAKKYIESYPIIIKDEKIKSPGALSGCRNCSNRCDMGFFFENRML